jgi:hypothetical protein
MAEEMKEYYEGAELETLISSIDWPNFLPVLYAITRNMMFKRFLSDPEKGILGRTFKDFAHDAVTAFLEGRRKCPKDIKLEYFFLASVRSIISKHIGKHFSQLSIDSTESDILQHYHTSINSTYDQQKVKNYVYKKLEKDDISKAIFDCWAEGISKPAEIRELYDYSESDFNNGKKRLVRVLTEVRTHLKNER